MKENKSKTGLILAIVAVVLIVVIICTVVIVNKNKKTNVELSVPVASTESLDILMDKLYEGVPEDSLPMALRTSELAEEDVTNFVGTSDIDFKEGVVSESRVGSIAHSVVLLRVNNAANATDAVAKIKENANPRKWICVEASNVVVKSKGDLVVLIMTDEEKAPLLEANFDNL